MCLFSLLNLQETEPKLSPSWNPKIICEPHPQFTEPVCASTPFEPVQVGCLSGRLELSLVLKQIEAMPGAKVWNPTTMSNKICIFITILICRVFCNVIGTLNCSFEWDIYTVCDQTYVCT